VKERVDRFQEFVDLLVRLRAEDHVTSEGTWFSSYDARTLPPLRDVPLVVAGNGPRSVRFAARRGDAWVTTGGRAETMDDWFGRADGVDPRARRGAERRRSRAGRIRPLPQPRLLAAASPWRAPNCSQTWPDAPPRSASPT
jgi:alkanesulfonate monooxygenase SsuD/methylene tetrahydromethanopterin reductase-like flavin-dependent oxidoreductase (luciferase family)